MTRRHPDAAPVHQRLTAALVDLAGRGRRPRCGDPVTRDLWTSEDPEERQLAASWCTGCPVLDECHAAGAGETFGVWAGMDRTKRNANGKEAA
jgi:hypothetical protein